MAYQKTPAFMTASDAWHAGDDVWPGPLVIRRANVYAPTDDLEMPGAELGSLGWAESIGPAITALAALGKTAYDIRRSQLDSKRAREQSAAAERAATEAAAATRAAAATAATATAEQAKVLAASGGLPLGQTAVLMSAAGLGVLGLGLYLLLRRKK